MRIAKEDIYAFPQKYALSLLLNNINVGAKQMLAGQSFQILGEIKAKTSTEMFGWFVERRDILTDIQKMLLAVELQVLWASLKK